jgi:leader peptidase (prepilin peptidase)/N-methyltransferase
VLFRSFVFAASLLAVSVIDLEHRIVPNEISIPGIVLGLVFAGISHYLALWDCLAGIVTGGGFLLVIGFFYEAATKREGIGGGDIKLMAMIGAFLGWKGSLFTIFVGSCIASLIGISLMIIRKANGKLPIPFGPFLSGAAVLYLMEGEQIIRLYWSLLHVDFSSP